MLNKHEKCAGRNCPIRENCYNYTTREVSEKIVREQIYNLDEKSCQHFQPIVFVTGH